MAPPAVRPSALLPTLPHLRPELRSPATPLCAGRAARVLWKVWASMMIGGPGFSQKAEDASRKRRSQLGQAGLRWGASGETVSSIESILCHASTRHDLHAACLHVPLQQLSATCVQVRPPPLFNPRP